MNKNHHICKYKNYKLTALTLKHSFFTFILLLSVLFGSNFDLQAQKSAQNNGLDGQTWKEKIQSISLHMPLDIPLFLAGNFCELRPNHFHGGIDIKTQGRSGLKVYASDDGYISRIKVSPYGYGQALYIHHPKTGLTTVYAHLSKFNTKIAKHIKHLQYQKESYALDINPTAEEFKITKGQFIAFSGNSGGSHAPHLHYEIRESSNQEPINPLYYPFDIKDHISPDINGLVNYSLHPNNHFSILNFHPYKLIKKGNHYHLNDTVEAPLITSFGLKCYDRSDGMSNLNGVYEMKMFIDSVPYFSFKMDQFSFSESKYINSFIDYALYKADKGRFIKCFVEPQNKLSLYPIKKKDGILMLEDGRFYKVHFDVMDNHGNKSFLDFTMKGVDKMQCLPDPSKFKASSNKINTFTFHGAQLNLPKQALYVDQYLDFEQLDSVQGASSGCYQVHSEKTPLHKKAKLTLPIHADIPKDLKEKICLAQLNKKGEWHGVNSTVNRFSIEAKIKSFGIYSSFLDTVPPEISLVNIEQDKNMAERISIRVKAIDKLSGIKNYRGYIDGKWVLMAYDAKNDLFIYNFENVAKGTKHLFEFHVTDKRNNKSVIKIDYTR